MTAKDLKNALLQEAVQGKLVPQIAAEGNAKDLLEEIRKEKSKLVKEGKLKKEKPLPEIKEEEIPFDIPENWCWCKIKDIAYVSTGMTPLKSESKFYENGNIPWVTSTLTSSDYIDKADTYITEFALNNTTLDLYPVHTLILAMYGQGKTRGQISELLIPATINQACAAIELYSSNETLRKYMKLFHNWNYNNLRKEAAGSAQPNLNLNIIQNTLFPLPPLAEQKRIVATIEKFMPLIEEYGKKETELKTFNEQIGALTKKAILQEAIQGKLVPQIVAEGNAKDLLEEIKKEKTKLIKEGKIKKEKTLPEITEDEIPFDIPENWCWCRLGDIVSILGDGIHGTPNYDISGNYYFVNGNNLNDGKIEIKPDTKKVNQSEYEKYKKELNNNTVFVSINGTLGNVAFYENEKIILGKSACYFNLIKNEMKSFIYWLIKTKYFLDYANEEATGTTIKNVSLATMRSFPIPLPPLAEQKRIVAAIEKLLPLCEKLGEK